MEYSDIINNDIIMTLLRDDVTGKNIVWATSSPSHNCEDTLTLNDALGIKSRNEKKAEETRNREKKCAEVFTPTWTVNKQLNLIDNRWFGKENVFNTETEDGWVNSSKDISFDFGYIASCRIEVCCGEAPYITTRYDTYSRERIALIDRVGMLDRKLRMINCDEHSTDDGNVWFANVKEAYKSIFAYEYQGDNLFLARLNLLYTFIDNFMFVFGVSPDNASVKEVAEIVAVNVFQLDGINYMKPFSYETDMFGIDRSKPINVGKGFLKSIDVIVGNPPYQANLSEGNGTASALYQFFALDAMKSSARYISLIIPARWFGTAKGVRIKEFKREMMRNRHICEMVIDEDEKKYFPNNNIAGGVCYYLIDKEYTGDVKYTYYDLFGKKSITKRKLSIDGFEDIIKDPVAARIIERVLPSREKSFGSLVSKKTECEKLPKAFLNNLGKYADYLENANDDNAVYVVGAQGKKGGSKRVRIAVKKNKIGFEDIPNKYKIFATSTYQATAFYPPEYIPADRDTTCTETFLTIGYFDTKEEMDGCLAYMDTDFFRFLVLTRRSGINLGEYSYSHIPLVDFNRSYTDEELFKMFKLTAEEKKYIKTIANKMRSKKYNKQTKDKEDT